jgi:nitroimidazol reductase NimA-like FMN-containing flavoprotein (pyridoxamine 5'-phosphate oxidase superfamily)
VDANRLTAAPDDPERRSALDHAVDFLNQNLSEGPQPQAMLIAQAKDLGISPRTLYRAKRPARVRTRKEKGAGGVWVWELSSQAAGS